MSNSPHPLADLAARWLRATRAWVGPRPADSSPQAIDALAVAIRTAARWRRVRRLAAMSGVGVASAAAAMIIILRARGPASPPLSAVVGAQAAPSRSFTIGGTGAGVVVNASGAHAVAGTVLAAGDVILSRTETLALAAADGTSLSLAPRSEIELQRGDAWRLFRLQAGSVEAHVAKLATGERFVIATADREVEVRGTRFRVSLVPTDPGCGGGTVTRVSVDEGVVVVRGAGQEARVAAGAHWPEGCEVEPQPARRGEDQSAAQPAPREEPQRRSHPAVRHTAAVRAPAHASEADAPATSTLAVENDLFGQAVRAERAGDSAAAVGLLDRLIARYPTSPLRESAELERAAMLKRAASPAPAGQNGH